MNSDDIWDRQKELVAEIDGHDGTSEELAALHQQLNDNVVELVRAGQIEDYSLAVHLGVGSVMSESDFEEYIPDVLADEL